MGINLVAFILGAVLLLIAILGGGIKYKDIDTPPIGPAMRIVAGLFSIVFIVLGIILTYPGIIKFDSSINENSNQNLKDKTTSDKFGAIAFSESTSRYGYGINYSTRDEAEKWALYDCKAKDAKILLSFRNACAALASGQNGKVGKAQANSKEEAERLALADCSERDHDCKVIHSDCTSH